MRYSKPRTKPADRWSLPLRLALIGYWALMFVGTHIPRTPRLLHVEGLDKAMHFAAYFGLAVLAACYVSLRRRFTLVYYPLALIGLAGYAMADELLQIPTGRNCSFWDWVADMAGGAAGLACFGLVRMLVWASSSASAGGRSRV